MYSWWKDVCSVMMNDREGGSEKWSEKEEVIIYRKEKVKR